MRLASGLGTAFALVVALGACGGAPMHVAAIDDMERTRTGAGAQEGGHLAPEVYARAEEERRLALSAHAAGDDVGAVLHAQRAIATYDHAVAIVRLARATTELADARKALEDANVQAQTLEASRAELDHEASGLDERIHESQGRILPAASAPGTPERDAARLVAARSLAVEAHLLCDAARLVVPDAAGLGDADGDVKKLETRLGGAPHPTLIDDAARARSRCLDVLTRARRAMGDDAGPSDALLAELSASGGWAPVRDERGVVVTLHGAFHGNELASDVEARLKDLGRVAAAHPGFGLQLVVHDAQTPTAKDADLRRADAAVKALVAGGAASGRIQPEQAGTRAPLVDPADAKQRSRNERLDVVFVASGR